MNELAVFASPLPFSNKQIKAYAVIGSTINEIIDLVCPERLRAAGIGAIVQINGHIVHKKYWHRVRPKEGTIINVRIVPQGGGGKKNPLVTILSIAVMVAAPMAGAALAGSMGVTSAIGVGLVKAGVGIVGSMLVSALAPPPKPSNYGSSASASPTQYIEGASNSINHFGVVPICLGTNRMFPLQAALPYTENQGSDQYVRQLFTFGYGSVEISDLRLGETLISQFDDIQIEHKLLGDLNTGTSLYSNDVNQDGYSALISSADGYLIRQTRSNIDEAIVDIAFPIGLVSYQNAKGFKEPFTVNLRLDYAPVDSLVYSSYINITVKAAQSEVIRVSRRVVFPANGTYNIRLIRITPDANDEKISDRVNLTSIRNVKYQNPVNLPGLSGTAIRMRATDQLNGVIDQYNALVSSIIPDYDLATESWINRITSNPASIYRHVMQGLANDRPLPDSKIDLIGLEDWHVYCAAQGYSYNRVIDYETSVDEILRDISAAGAAAPAIVDGKRTVVIDRIKDDIVQVITPRNSWGYSGEMAYPQLPHAFRVQFRNAEKGYQQDERIVYDDGYNEDNATKFEALELQSCTSSALAFKTGRRHIASSRLRPETHSFVMDVENLVALRGNRIKLAHDVPLVGVGDGRIKSISDDTDNITGFTLDDTVSIPFASTYYVRIRLSDGTWLYREITTGAGDQKTFIFSTPFPIGDIPISVGDLAYIVEAGGELDLIITRIEPQDDLAARITAIDYAPAIFTAENTTIPAFKSNVTTPLEFVRPKAPVLIAAQSNESVMLINSDGSLLPRAVFTLRNDNDGEVSVHVKTRRSGTDVFSNANILESSPERVVLTGLEDGNSYDIHIRYQRRGSSTLSLAYQLNSYKFIGASGIPGDVSGFIITVTGETALLKWDSNDDIDLSHYLLKFSSSFTGATWGTAQLLEEIVYENRLTIPFQPGTYLIKAIDLSGNESLNATSIITYDPGLVQNAVEIISEHPEFGGIKDNVILDGNGIVLAEEGNDVGYYYFDNTVDLTGVFASFVSASIGANGVFFNNLFDVDDLFSMPDMFGSLSQNLFDEEDLFEMDDMFGIGADAWEVQLEYRISMVDPVGDEWTEWNVFTASTIEFWAIQFRVKLTSLQQYITPKISILSIAVDMPDRIERGEDMLLAVDGATVTYPVPFKNNPAVAITIQDGEASDEIEFINKTSSGFFFKVYNRTALSYVERSYDFISSGYGRQNT